MPDPVEFCRTAVFVVGEVALRVTGVVGDATARIGGTDLPCGVGVLGIVRSIRERLLSPGDGSIAFDDLFLVGANILRCVVVCFDVFDAEVKMVER